MKETLNRLETAKRESEEVISNLQCQIQSLSTQLDHFTIDEKEFKRNASKNELEMKNQIACLQNELSVTIKAKESMDFERTQLIGQLDALKKSGEATKFESEEMISNLQGKIQSLSVQLEQLKENEIARLQNELTAMRKAKESVDFEQKQLVDQLDSMNKKMKTVQNESEETISNLRSEIESMSVQVHGFIRKEKELKQNISENDLKAKNEIMTLRNELSDMKEAKECIDFERNQLSEQLNAMNKKENAAKHENEQMISNLRSEIQSLKAQLDKLISDEKEFKRNACENELKAKSEIARLQSELTEIRKDKDGVDLERKQLADQIDSMNKKMEVVKNESERTISNLQSKVHFLTEQLDQSTTIEKELKQKMNENEVKVKNEIARLQNELTEITKAKERIDLEHKRLAEQLQTMEKKKSGSMAGQSSWSTSKSMSFKRDQSVDIEKLRDENRILHTQQQQLQQEISDLRKSTNGDRKKKRQSIHDDTRRISGYDATMIEMEVQTDPVDQKCACIDLNNKVSYRRILCIILVSMKKEGLFSGKRGENIPLKFLYAFNYLFCR